jgi:hypothetical protein
MWVMASISARMIRSMTIAVAARRRRNTIAARIRA